MYIYNMNVLPPLLYHFYQLLECHFVGLLHCPIKNNRDTDNTEIDGNNNNNTKIKINNKRILKIIIITIVKYQ